MVADKRTTSAMIPRDQDLAIELRELHWWCLWLACLRHSCALANQAAGSREYPSLP